MHREISVKDRSLFDKIGKLSNPSKFRIIELTQKEKASITDLAKKVNLAFNKCSNYCADLVRIGFLEKEKEGKNVFVKSKVNLSKIKKTFD